MHPKFVKKINRQKCCRTGFQNGDSVTSANKIVIVAYIFCRLNFKVLMFAIYVYNFFELDYELCDEFHGDILISHFLGSNLSPILCDSLGRILT